jgi:hypothetical protein
MKSKTILGSLVAFCAAVAISFAADANPNMGTWKLNEAKSKFAAGAQKNHTVVYSAAPNDMIKVTVDGTDKDGKAQHNEWVGKFDGKDYPVTGDPNFDARSYKVVDAQTLDMTVKKGGKVLGTGKIVVSADGKSRTVTTTATDPKMTTFNNTAVFDKQ